MFKQTWRYEKSPCIRNAKLNADGDQNRERKEKLNELREVMKGKNDIISETKKKLQSAQGV